MTTLAAALTVAASTVHSVVWFRKRARHHCHFHVTNKLTRNFAEIFNENNDIGYVLSKLAIYQMKSKFSRTLLLAKVAGETFSYLNGLEKCCECVAKTPISTKRTKAIMWMHTTFSRCVFALPSDVVSVTTTLVKRSRTALRIDMDRMLVCCVRFLVTRLYLFWVSFGW